MDWNTIGQNIISSTISGILVVIFGGITGWFVYITGIKGKEKDQAASERKNQIYIPLKYELDSISHTSDNIWEKIESPEARKIVEKNDEFVVSESLFQQCDFLFNLINNYNSINLYTVASNILCKRFEEKYIELYGSITHPIMHWDEYTKEEVEMEDWDQEFVDFRCNVYVKNNIDSIFKNDPGYEEYCQDIGRIGPTEEYLTLLFSSVLPKKENTYIGIDFDSVNCEELTNKKITPAEYMIKDFNFFDRFEKDEKVQQKKSLLIEIKELSFSIYEDVTVKIRAIGKKYEVE
ncbi:MAG: hypothetical protein K0R15_2045 [Clostridiales bacterium]|jgi:hypothetical protein|nr:hypothetical protein [Clostridiales bacterium]